MSSIFFVEPMVFGLNPKTNDNSLFTDKIASASKTESDKVLACTLVNEMCSRLQGECNVEGIVLPLRREVKREHYLYEDKGEAVCAADSISFHAFTDDEGNVTRRVVVLYPMSPFRQGELPKKFLVSRCTDAASDDSTKLDIIDLRDFQEEGKYLEGNGALVFSPDGKYVYMSRSTRTNDEVLEVLCSEENLNIPPENRFIFTSSLNVLTKNDRGEIVPDKTRKMPAHHTNALGWCGTGICAWALDHLVFDSEAEKNRFYNHIDSTYKEVLLLNDAELRAFAGNAIEIASRSANGSERRILCIPERALMSMQRTNAKVLYGWYGDASIITFHSETIERRCGASIKSCMVVTHVKGPAIPKAGEQSIISIANIGGIDKI